MTSWGTTTRPTDDPLCVIRLNSFAGSAGINDITTRMKGMLQYALAFGCALIVPRPHDGLTAAHNNDTLLDPSVWWTRYYKVGRGLGLSNGWEWLWESVPVGRPVHTRSVPGDPMPSPEIFAQLRADAIAHGTIELLEVREWRRGSVSAQLQQMQDAGEELSAILGIRSVDLPWPARSAEVEARSEAVSKALFGSTPFISLHLRRGDAVGSYRPPRCAEVPAVLARLLSAVDTFEECSHMRAVFISTDERGPTYLNRLRADLEAFFDTVRIETLDVPPHLRAPLDNYFDFLVATGLRFQINGSSTALPHQWARGNSVGTCFMQHRPQKMGVGNNAECGWVDRPFTMPPPPPPPPPPLPPLPPPPPSRRASRRKPSV